MPNLSYTFVIRNGAVSVIYPPEGSGVGKGQEALLLSVAEQLKQPLLYIARSSELALMEDELDRSVLRDMESHAAMALKLLDSYILGVGVASQQAALELESVSLSALLSDVAHELSPLAKQYDVELEVMLDGKYGPVMSHPQALRAALHSLGGVIVGLPTNQRQTIMRLGAHKTDIGIVTGVYHSSMHRLPGVKGIAEDPKRAERRQPFAEIGGGSAAGVFVAQQLFRCMQTSLDLRRHKGLQGFAATLQPSKQLALL